MIIVIIVIYRREPLGGFLHCDIYDVYQLSVTESFLSVTLMNLLY